MCARHFVPPFTRVTVLKFRSPFSLHNIFFFLGSSRPALSIHHLFTFSHSLFLDLKVGKQNISVPPFNFLLHCASNPSSSLRRVLTFCLSPCFVALHTFYRHELTRAGFFNTFFFLFSVSRVISQTFNAFFSAYCIILNFSPPLPRDFSKRLFNVLSLFPIYLFFGAMRGELNF